MLCLKRGTFEWDGWEGDGDCATVHFYFGYTDIDACSWFGHGIFGDLEDVSILLQAPSLYFIFEFLQDILIVLESIHIVMREGELSFEISVDEEHPLLQMKL